MSTLFDYIKSLLPKFGRDKVMELARQTQNELTQFVIPSYVEAEKGIGSRTMASQKLQVYDKIIKRQLKTNRPSDNIISIIRKSLEQIAKNNQVIESHVEDSMEDEVIVAGVTILKVNLLRFIEVSSFTARYAAKFLNYVYILETAAVNGDTKYVEDSLSKGEIVWLEERFNDFVLAMAALTRNERDLSVMIKSLPEITIDDNIKSTSATLGETKFDPFGFGRLSGFTHNPVLHIGLIVAQYQASRYKEQKETKTILSLRLLNLTNGARNAKVDKEIEVIQRRIDNLSDQIRRAEED